MKLVYCLIYTNFMSFSFFFLLLCGEGSFAPQH